MSELFKKFDQWGIQVYNYEAFITMLEWDGKARDVHNIYLFDSEKAESKLKDLIRELNISLSKDEYYPLVTKRALLMLLDILDIAQKEGEGRMEYFIESLLREALIIEDRWKYMGVGNSDKTLEEILKCLQ